MRVGGQGGQHVLHIQAGRLHQGLFEGLAIQGGGRVCTGTLDALAHQAEAIAVHAAAGQAQHHVAGFHVSAGQDFGFLDGADGKASQVVFAGGVHAGHLGRFAAYQGAAGQLAAPGNAADHGRSGVHIQLAAGKVVQEEQRLCALHQHVVDAHGHQVYAHGVVHIPFKGQLELGAHAVGAAHQHWLLVALGHLEQRTKAANAGQHALAHGFLGQGLDAFHQCVTGVDVYACVFVGEGGGGRGLGHGKWLETDGGFGFGQAR